MNGITIYQTKIIKEQLPGNLTYLKFFFQSDGFNGQITKIVTYYPIKIIEDKIIFNLGFGDYNEDDGSVSDIVNSNNGDIWIVFNTVLNTIPIFFKHNPNHIILVSCSDDDENYANICRVNCKKKCIDKCKNIGRRIRGYRNFINRNYLQLVIDYEFFGSFKEDLNNYIKYEPETKYDSLLIFNKK